MKLIFSVSEVFDFYDFRGLVHSYAVEKLIFESKQFLVRAHTHSRTPTHTHAHSHIRTNPLTHTHTHTHSLHHERRTHTHTSTFNSAIASY